MTQNCVKKTSVVLSIITLFSPFSYSQAEEFNNNTYSYFGIGTQILNYQEALSNNAISSKSNPTAMVQYSGAYTALDDGYGFYITTTSPLFTVSDKESWNHSTFGSLQTNRTELGISNLSITGSRLMAPGHQALFGLRYTLLNFTRYDFAPGAGALAYNDELITNDNLLPPAEQNPAYDDGVAFEIPGCTNHTNPPVEGMTCDSFAIQEQLSSLSLSFGYKYDSFFRADFTGPRFSFETSLSLPVFYVVTNTSQPGAVLVGSLGQGYGIYLNTATSIYSRKDFQVSLGVELQLIHRNQVTDTANGLIYPNSDTTTAALYTSFSWAFE
jgi:hypothetical protein